MPTLGQHYVHTALWLRLAPSVELNENWAILSDVWYRRQNDRHESGWNPLSAPSLNPSGRIGLTYRTDHWAFIAYPAAIYQSFPTLGKEADYSRPRTREFRPQIFVEWTRDMAHQFSVRIRGGYEYRKFPNAPASGRARLRLMVRKELSEQIYTSLWNETLSPVAPNVAVRQLYEINRTNLALGRAITEHLTLEAGYQFTYRQRRSLIEYDEEHALVLTAFLRF